jgi:hypothetical protein
MSRIDFRDPAQNLRAFVKLMGDLDPSKPVYSGFGGHIFAYVGNKPAQMLCGVEGFGVLRNATAKRYPEFFEAPAPSDWGKPNDSSWGTHTKECPPRPPS